MKSMNWRSIHDRTSSFIKKRCTCPRRKWTIRSEEINMEALVSFFSHYMLYILMGLTLLTAVGVVYSKNAVHSVVALLLTMILVAGIYLMLDAEFIAAVQLLVYAGGIIVLFVFMLLLVALHKDEAQRLFNTYTVVSLGLVAFLVIVLAVVFFGMPFGPEPATVTNIVKGGSTEAVAGTLYSTYILPFEIASILLLVVMVGAIVLTKERVKS
ncbi:MAG: NADH-quinone oxidoreductase subunit J [Acidobacteria bacterium]|nr:MAG: NADH-quinone oxidoreductase subunit J [Acidobacteriota bacterium]